MFEIVKLLGLLSFKLENETWFCTVPLNMVRLNPFDPIKVSFVLEALADGLT